MTSVDAEVGHDLGGLFAAADELAACALTLARRFAAGATLWAAAPRSSHHARHIAVEFVHPVVVGKRSLPAVALEAGPDLVGPSRSLVRPGDVVLAVGDPTGVELAPLLQRREPWGVTTISLATGQPSPKAPLTDHTVWTGADEDGIVLAYHLLWELTHVVFDHPGLLREPDDGRCVGDVCITCSDEGRLVEVTDVVDLHTVNALGGGTHEEVDVSLVGSVTAGDLLLVHAGLALQIMDAGAPR